MRMTNPNMVIASLNATWPMAARSRQNMETTTAQSTCLMNAASTGYVPLNSISVKQLALDSHQK